jgi:hypothetical protein
VLLNGLQQNDDAVQNIKRALETLLVSVEEVEGVDLLFSLLNPMLTSTDLTLRNNVIEAFEYFFAHNESDIDRYISEYITRLVYMLKLIPGKIEMSTVKVAWSCLNALTKRISKEEADKYVIVTRKALLSCVSSFAPGTTIDGLCLVKGAAPILPIYLNGLIYASNLVKEVAVLGIGELIKHSTADALKPFVIPITGPLIRIIGDRIPIEMKEAILKTMGYSI